MENNRKLANSTEAHNPNLDVDVKGTVYELK